MGVKTYAGLVLLFLILICPASAAGENPYQKIVVIRFSFAGSEIQTVSSEIQYGTAPNPALQEGPISGLLLDSNNQLISRFSLRDPRIQIGEGVETGATGNVLTGTAEYARFGDFGVVVPFSRNLRYVVLRDAPSGSMLTRVDLSPAIAAFGQLYPLDPDMQPARNPAVSPQLSSAAGILVLLGIVVMGLSVLAWYFLFFRNRAERILIVDDEREIAEVFSLLLENKGYATTKAHSGAECLSLLKAWWKRPDLILLDVMMSPMDGWETLEKIKSDPSTKTIPVLMLTGRNPTPGQAHRYGLCIDDYLLKPVNAHDLYDAVRHVLDRRKRIRQDVRAAMKAGYEKDIVCAYAALRRRVEVDKKLLGIISTAHLPGESGPDTSYRDIVMANREFQSHQEMLGQLQRKLAPVLSTSQIH